MRHNILCIFYIHSKVDVVMKYHESVLEDFSGVLIIDSHSNAFLNLTLINTMGSVHGTISTINYTQVSTNHLQLHFQFCDYMLQMIRVFTYLGIIDS